MLKEKILYKVTKWLVSFYRWMMLEASLTLTEPLPAGPKIFVANHPSSLDPFYVKSLLTEKVVILIGADFFKLFLLGALFRYIGHIPVVQGKGQEILEKAVQVIKKGQSVLIFIEGELSPNVQELRKPKTGAARLALMTGAPIVPLGIYLESQRSKVYQTKVNGHEKRGLFYLKGPYQVTAGKVEKIEGNSQ